MSSNFSVAYTDGVTVEPWNDPPSGGVPTRLNAFEEHGHLRHVGEVGTEVEISATVGGVLAPLDAALGGLLFTFHFAELPGIVAPAVSSPAGQSSIQRFTPPAAGHYTFKLKRPTLGAVILHLDVV
jgi:hypothetical protein